MLVLYGDICYDVNIKQSKGANGYGELFSRRFRSAPTKGTDAQSGLTFRWYNPEEPFAGKPMRERLKSSMACWYTLYGGGSDMFGLRHMANAVRCGRSNGRLPKQGSCRLRAAG